MSLTAIADMSSLQLLADSWTPVIRTTIFCNPTAPHVKRCSNQTRLMQGVAIVHLKVCMITRTSTPALQSRKSCRGMEDGDRYG